jgi:hypothetical protein
MAAIPSAPKAIVDAAATTIIGNSHPCRRCIDVVPYLSRHLVRCLQVSSRLRIGVVRMRSAGCSPQLNATRIPSVKSLNVWTIHVVGASRSVTDQRRALRGQE